MFAHEAQKETTHGRRGAARANLSPAEVYEELFVPGLMLARTLGERVGLGATVVAVEANEGMLAVVRAVAPPIERDGARLAPRRPACGCGVGAFGGLSWLRGFYGPCAT